MRQSPLLISSLLIASLALSGCGTTRFFKKPPENKPSTVCSKIDKPREESLKTFTFFPLPVGTTAEGGVPLVGGVTADGMASIVNNLAILKKREEGWQARAKAVNDCLDKEAQDRKTVSK